jgi:cytochrome c biogenesis protein CcmG/thiol:disulfide interchange protein DsbE
MYRKLLLLLSLVSVVLLPAALAAEAAPAFTLSTVDNKSVTLADLKGKVVYVDFWATWCPPCRKSFPWMNETYQRYHDKGLEVVAINLDKEPGLVRKFLAEVPAKFTIALDPQGKTAETYKLLGMPTSYLIDRRGRLVMTHMGFNDRDKDELERAIKSALAQE